MNIRDRIADLEDRIVNARDVTVARRLHAELDELRARLPDESDPEVTYRRGYQAGHAAARAAAIRQEGGSE